MDELNNENPKNSDGVQNNKIITIIISSIAILSFASILFFVFNNIQFDEQAGELEINQQNNKSLSKDGIILDLDDICSASKISELIDFCYINAAIENRDTVMCQKIADNSEWVFKEECEDAINEKLAYEKKDVKYCLDLDSLNYNLRDCVTNVAELTGDTNVCQYWPSNLKREVCEDHAKIGQAVVANDKGICDAIDFYQTKSKCYGELGISRNDPLLCNLAGTLATNYDYDQDKRECYRKLAMKNINQEYCQYMYEGNEEYCIEDINTIKKNFKQCIEGSDKNNCLAIVPEIIDDVEDCRMTSDETAYYPVSLKNCYFKVSTKCEEMSSEKLKEECVAFVNKKYNQEVEANEEFDSYAKQLGLDKKLEPINIKYDLERNVNQELVESKVSDDSKIEQKETNNKKLKSIISSTVPSMILCMDDNGYMMDPVENGEICRGDFSSTWPVISDGDAKWGGCKMSVSRVDGVIQSFEYCATLSDESIVRCSEIGCIFE